MASLTLRRVVRYAPAQRFLHWMGVAGFAALLITGAALLWSPLAPLAAGGMSRLMHRLGAVIYMLWPLLYAILDPKGLRETVAESLTWTRADLGWFKYAVKYFFGDPHGAPPQGRVNAGQKLHHLGVGLASIVVGVSGFGLWLGVGRLGAANLGLVASVHDLSMLALTVLLVGHVYFTFLYGGLDAMLKGHVSEEYAQMEHARWLASLPESAFIVPGPSRLAPAAPTSSESVIDAATPADHVTEPQIAGENLPK